MLSICIVFVPVAFLSGVAASLFVPLALAVLFAMIPSYLLSRTLVTTMMQAMLGKELDLYRPLPEGAKDTPSRRNPIWHIHELFDHVFENCREVYGRTITWVVHNRTITLIILFVFFGISACLLPFIGQDFFPSVDAGQMRLHVRVPSGTRLDFTGKRFSEIEETIRQTIPANQLALILDNIGLASGTSYVRGSSSTIGSSDGEIDISLTPVHTPMSEVTARLRKVLLKSYPDCTFYFQPADIETQVLDFGTSAPIDVQVLGSFKDSAANYALAQDIQRQS